MQAPITSMYYNNDQVYFRRIRKYTWLLVVGWTLLMGTSCYWNVAEQQKVLNKVAMAEARAAIGRDLLYRRWGSSHGGIYVPVTEMTPLNPYLSHAPERDISTPSGRPLTLINPAYMARQVYELAKEKDTFIGRGHLTSLKPLRPENLPDPWEEKVLRSFEQGVTEASEVAQIDGQPYMRLMKPFVTEKSCLKCHAVQGYQAGDVRGGMSVSIPIRPLIDASRTQIAGTLATHGALWLLGLGAIGLGGSQLSRSAHAQKRIETELHLQTLHMAEEITERQKAQEALQKSEAHLKVVADFAANWEYWRLPDDTLLYMSPSASALTGYTAEEFMHDRELLPRMIHPDDRELFRHHTHDIGENGQILPIEMRIVTKGGDLRWIGHTCRQVLTPEGQPWGWRASNQDITLRKQMEHELFEQAEQLEQEVAEREASQDELEQMNHSLEEHVTAAVADLRRKDQMLIQQSRLAAMGEMINNIAHQWRQPLNNIGLIIQNLQISYDTGTISREKVKNEISKAMTVLMHMSRTIDDFRNFFREDKEKRGFFIDKAVSRALEFVSAALESRNIRVEVDAEQDVTAIGYQNEYAQVLLNIISNASEACVERCEDQPCISIRIRRENARSVVYIRDNCGGIPDNVMPKIFDPYFTTRAPDKGTGIGLYMSKVIIEQNMDGRLTARNVDGGAEFRIEV